MHLHIPLQFTENNQCVVVVNFGHMVHFFGVSTALILQTVGVGCWPVFSVQQVLRIALGVAPSRVAFLVSLRPILGHLSLAPRRAIPPSGGFYRRGGFACAADAVAAQFPSPLQTCRTSPSTEHSHLYYGSL